MKILQKLKRKSEDEKYYISNISYLGPSFWEIGEIEEIQQSIEL
jgi:hypothetical protein